VTAAAAPFLIVAIDGGAASGKSSSSRLISERFNFLHVDTGSFYRAITAGCCAPAPRRPTLRPCRRLWRPSGWALL
jgi:cytidylate kinase